MITRESAEMIEDVLQECNRMVHCEPSQTSVQIMLLLEAVTLIYETMPNESYLLNASSRRGERISDASVSPDCRDLQA